MAGYNILQKIRGTLFDIFQIGKSGPQFKKESASIMQVRNSDDSAFGRLKAASPASDDDVVTRRFLDTVKGSVIVARQADCSSSLPANTSTRGYVVVSTPGTGTVLGDLLYDDGSATGTMVIVAKTEGRIMAVTDALSGGTATFEADSIYVWDEDGGSWLKIGDIGSVTGAVRRIRYSITNSASQDSASSVPANARIERTDVEVTTPYSGGGTIAVGKAGGTTDLVQATTDNDPQTANIYSVPQDTSWGAGAAAVRTTIAGSPAAGAGVVSVWYSMPNA